MLNLSTASRLVFSAAAPAAEQNNGFVVLLGVGTVFAGLIALIVICKLMGLFFAGNNNAGNEPVKSAPAAAPVAAQEIPNRQEMVAAISAVLAEELGTDVSAIRIHSIKRV